MFPISIDRSRSVCARALLLTILVSLPHLASADNEPRLRLSTGFDYSSGDYGSDETTKILYIPVTARYETDSAHFKLTVPYVSIETENCVVIGGGEVVCGGSTGTSSTEAASS